MKNLKLFAVIALTFLVTLTFFDKPACARTLPIAVKRLPTAVPWLPAKILAHAPEIISTWDKLVIFLKKHPIPAPTPNPLCEFLGFIAAAYFVSPAEFTPPPETPHSIGEFYHESPLFDFDQ